MSGLIERQKAIEVIDGVFPVDPMKSEYTQGIACGAALAKTYVEQLPSAQPVDKDMNVPCTDTISRKAAIDAHYEYCNKHPDAGFPVWSLKILEDLPPAQPEPSMEECACCVLSKPESKWIPVSERLPEPRVAVLGYAPKFKNIFALYYDSVMGWMVWSPIRDDCLPNSQGDIIAWMPLPEPYAERRTDGLYNHTDTSQLA